MENTLHTMVMYSLMFLLAVWLVCLTILFPRPSGQSWVCSSLVCSKVLTGDEWASQNCYASAGENNTIMCKVIINGNTTLVPASSLGNISSLRQCLEYRCSEEVSTRPVNYTFNLTAGKLFLSNTISITGSGQ